jgi:5-methylcytosine-specific restriction endonuclease McrA
VTRIHRVTHPVLGPASWDEIGKAAQARRVETGKKVCSWCFCLIPKGRRTTRCSDYCSDLIAMSASWSVCAWNVMEASRGVCALCGYQSGRSLGWYGKYEIEVDHIVPVSLGGTGDLSNLRALCRECHRTETTRLARLKTAYVARMSMDDPVEPKPVRVCARRSYEQSEALFSEAT